MRRMKRTLAVILAVLCLLPVFAMPAMSDTISLPFEDVKTLSWMCRYVSYCYAKGLMNGKTGTQFCPYQDVTRAEFVTILGRAFDVNASTYRPKPGQKLFSDVDPDSYYAPYVNWAIKKGITNGVSADLFGPKKRIRRQDVAVMIARSQSLADPSLLTPTVDPVTFPDESSISAYAKQAVSLLQRQGILEGKSDGQFHPRGFISRAEAAAVFSRYHCRLKSHTHDYRQISHYTSSCTSVPRRKMACSCGSFYVEYHGNPPGHNYQVTGYTDDRQAILTCSRCGAVTYEPLPEAERIYSGDTLLKYSQITDWVDKLQQLYPDLIRTSTAGNSLKGLKIPLVEFGKGNRYILLNANIHAREYITTNYLLEVLDEYAYAYVKDEKIGSYRIRPLLDAFTLVIIPCSNPDGRAIAIDKDAQYKNNGRNVNLNNNFPTNWIYADSGENGASAGSEPETKVLMSVMSEYAFELVLDCHTAGNLFYYADSDCTSAYTKRAKALADALCAESGFSAMTFMANAGMANYARHPYGCLGFTVEMWPTYEHPIDCSGFYSKIWNRLSTMPAAAMNWLSRN